MEQFLLEDLLAAVPIIDMKKHVKDAYIEFHIGLYQYLLMPNGFFHLKLIVMHAHLYVQHEFATHLPFRYIYKILDHSKYYQHPTLVFLKMEIVNYIANSSKHLKESTPLITLTYVASSFVLLSPLHCQLQSSTRQPSNPQELECYSNQLTEF